MNSITIIGNLTRDPESRQVNTANGQTNVTTFTVAVNGSRKNDPAQFMRVTVWGKLGEVCQQYLAKGRKVAVMGSATASGFQSNKTGKIEAQIEINASNVEFLSSGGNGDTAPAPTRTGDYNAPAPAPAPQAVETPEDLPF